jgi:hypothetical protein
VSLLDITPRRFCLEATDLVLVVLNFEIVAADDVCSDGPLGWRLHVSCR